MYPPYGFPTPVPSFEFPVTPPGSQPFDDPRFQVCINQDWLPFIAGALKQLLLQSTWIVADDAALLDVQGRVFDLISAFGQVDEGCGVIVPSVACMSGSFLDLDFGFEQAISPDCVPTYTAGTGWQSCFAFGVGDVMELLRIFTASTFIRSFSATINNSNALIPYVATFTFFDHGVQTFQYQATVLTTNVTIAQPVNAPADTWLIDLRAGNLSHQQTFTLTDFELCYTGVFPLSVTPETWEVVVDFTTSNHGWSAIIGGDGHARALWTNGVGWQEGGLVFPQSDSELRITKNLASSHRFTDITIHVVTSHDLEQCYAFNFASNLGTTPNGTSEVPHALDVFTSNMRTDLVTSTNTTTTITVSRITFRGLGAVPTDLT